MKSVRVNNYEKIAAAISRAKNAIEGIKDKDLTAVGNAVSRFQDLIIDIQIDSKNGKLTPLDSVLYLSAKAHLLMQVEPMQQCLVAAIELRDKYRAYEERLQKTDKDFINTLVEGYKTLSSKRVPFDTSELALWLVLQDISRIEFEKKADENIKNA